MVFFKKHAANLITLSRIVFLPLLYYFVYYDMRGLFLITFIVVGSTDFFDGLVARKFNMVSKIGKFLDTVADIFFYFSTAYFFYELFPQYLLPNLTLFVIFFFFYFGSFIISTIICKRPIMLHTSLLRLNAVFVFSLVILSFLMPTTYILSIILILFMIGLSESMIIFILFGAVDQDTKSIFSLMKKIIEDFHFEIRIDYGMSVKKFSSTK
jgi:phosphatidylglycerophosphate synthase